MGVAPGITKVGVAPELLRGNETKDNHVYLRFEVRSLQDGPRVERLFLSVEYQHRSCIC